jgi:hypothetical protein
MVALPHLLIAFPLWPTLFACPVALLCLPVALSCPALPWGLRWAQNRSGSALEAIGEAFWFGGPDVGQQTLAIKNQQVIAVKIKFCDAPFPKIEAKSYICRKYESV